MATNTFPGVSTRPAAVATWVCDSSQCPVDAVQGLPGMARRRRSGCTSVQSISVVYAQFGQCAPEVAAASATPSG